MRCCAVLAAALAITVTGCGAREDVAGDRQQARLPEPQGQCIFVNTINDWKAVDPYRLKVRTRARGWQYEIELDRRCSDILFADAIAWPSTDNRICDYRADAILVRRQRCGIGAIRRLPDEPKEESTPDGR